MKILCASQRGQRSYLMVLIRSKSVGVRSSILAFTTAILVVALSQCRPSMSFQIADMSVSSSLLPHARRKRKRKSNSQPIQLTAIRSRPTLLSFRPISATGTTPFGTMCVLPIDPPSKDAAAGRAVTTGEHGGGAGWGVRHSVVSKASSSVVRSRPASELRASLEREMEVDALAMAVAMAPVRAPSKFVPYPFQVSCLSIGCPVLVEHNITIHSFIHPSIHISIYPFMHIHI